MMEPVDSEKPKKSRRIYILPEGYELPKKGLVRLPIVCGITGQAKSTIWARVKAGKFPKPVKLGPRTTAWRAEDLHRYLDEIGGQHAA